MSETIYKAKEKYEDEELLDPEDPPIAELADCTCPEFSRARPRQRMRPAA